MYERRVESVEETRGAGPGQAGAGLCRAGEPGIGIFHVLNKHFAAVKGKYSGAV